MKNQEEISLQKFFLWFVIKIKTMNYKNYIRH